MATRISTGMVMSQLAVMQTDFANGVLEIYGGSSQPADSNHAWDLDPETILLCVVTKDGGEFVAESPANGLNFGAPSAGALPKATSEIWRGTILPAAGAGTVATWYRFYDNAHERGASTTAKRFDGNVSTSSLADMQMSDTTLVAGEPLLIENFLYRPRRA